MYDKHILCNKCDNEILGRLETYASKVLLSKQIKNTNIISEISTIDEYFKIITLKNLNYKKFKLFLLSILWRSSISKLPFFEEVKLGIHSDIIRKMIFEDNPKENIDYETSIILLKSEQIPIPSVISPRYLKFDGNSSYIFHINNFMIHFNISKHNKLSMFEKTTIWKDNTMKIALLEDHIANHHFDSYLGKKLRLKSKI